jgi:hypothetical protein
MNVCEQGTTLRRTFQSLPFPFPELDITIFKEIPASWQNNDTSPPHGTLFFPRCVPRFLGG